MKMIESKQNLSRKSLFKDLNPNKNSYISPNNKSSSYNNLKIINDLGNPPPNNNHKSVVTFIKEKNKFFLENSFDVKGTREFLASKEVAMRAIKLTDEIIEDKKEEQRRTVFTNKNVMEINFLDECPSPKRKSAKLPGKRTISPRKSRKSHKKLGDNEIIKKKLLSDKKLIKLKEKKMKKNSRKKIKNKLNENSSFLSSENNNENENNIILNKCNDSKGSNIYKFIIDNANEQEENFQKKLKEELKKVENINPKKKEKTKSISKKDLKIKQKPKRMSSVTEKNRDRQSIFMFSEINKKLMADDDISISSIGEQNINLPPPTKKVIKRGHGSLNINSNQVKERLKEKFNKDTEQKEKKNDLNKMEDNSEKDSIISILSDLM